MIKETNVKNELVTIIVPVYNTEEYVRRCIESIISQTYKEIELILVDDGSTDKSGDICDEYSSKDSRIFVLHQSNRGVSAARNAGLKIATGKKVQFVDSDDVILNNTVEETIKAFDKTDTDIVFFGYMLMQKQVAHIHASQGKYLIKDFICEMTKREKMTCITGSVCFCIFKKDIIDDFSLSFCEALNYGEDMFFLLDYLIHTNKIYVLEEEFYLCYRYEKNERMSATSYVVIDIYKVYVKWFNMLILFLIEKKISDVEIKKAYQQFIDCLIPNIVRMINYEEFWDKKTLFEQLKNVLYNELVIKAIKSYKRDSIKKSVMIPLFIKLKQPILLYIAVKMRIKRYNLQIGKSNYIVSCINNFSIKEKLLM